MEAVGAEKPRLKTSTDYFSSSGYSHLIFKNTGNHFTWRKVTTLVNNIIVGKLWIDNVSNEKLH